MNARTAQQVASLVLTMLISVLLAVLAIYSICMRAHAGVIAQMDTLRTLLRISATSAWTIVRLVSSLRQHALLVILTAEVNIHFSIKRIVLGHAPLILVYHRQTINVENVILRVKLAVECLQIALHVSLIWDMIRQGELVLLFVKKDFKYTIQAHHFVWIVIVVAQLVQAILPLVLLARTC